MVHRYLFTGFLVIIACLTPHARAQTTQPAVQFPIPTFEELKANSDQFKEPPYWPYALRYSEEFKTYIKKVKRRRSKGADVLAWIPPETQHVRALLIIPNNTDSKHFGEHKALRDVAGKHDMAIVYLRKQVHSSMTGSGDLTRNQWVLDALAKLTNQPGISHAPWITFGKSSMGKHPFWMAWAAPKRSIAGISYHGETPRWPMDQWSKTKDENVLYLMIQGDKEWESTWYRHVRPMLLNYRQHTGWLPHQLVLNNVGHGYYKDMHGSKGWGKPVPEGEISVLRVWDYTALFIDKALTLRLPDDANPKDGLVTLKPVDLSKGYFLHPRAMEIIAGYKQRPIRRNEKTGLYTIVDHIKEPGENFEPNPVTLTEDDVFVPFDQIKPEKHANHYWLPDVELYKAWKALHTPTAPAE